MLTSRFLLVNTFVTFPVTENLIFVLFWTNPSGVGLKAPAEATKNFWPKISIWYWCFWWLKIETDTDAWNEGESRHILKLIPGKCPRTETRTYFCKYLLPSIWNRKGIRDLFFPIRYRYSRRSLISDHLWPAPANQQSLFSKLVCCVGNRLSTPSGQHLAPALYPIYYNPRFQK